MKIFIIHNGKFHTADKPVLKINNRAFCYGDSLFETMIWQNNHILFFQDHVDRLFNGMSLLKMKPSKTFSKTFIQKQVGALIKKNKISGSARVRLQVYRNAGGYYAPVDNTTSFVIATEKINERNFSLNKKGLSVDIFPEIKKSQNILSNFKTSNSSIYSLAGIFAKENDLDDCFILNSNENITDSISSNVFIFKNGTVSTPSLSDGCIDGVMRKNILKICKKEKIKIKEKSISSKELLNADEIFLTNAIHKIRWVKTFRKKNYKYDFSKFLINKLSEQI